MATWDEFDEKAKSDKDEERANLGLVATWDEFGSYFDEEDMELQNFTNKELVGLAKELARRCVYKSREFCKLKKKFDLLEASISLMEKEIIAF